MMVVGRLLKFIDPRPLVGFGMALSLWSIWETAYFSPNVSASWIVITSIAQGFGLGFIFVPLNSAAFATLSATLRTDAVALWTLIRNIGSSVGVSIVIAQLTSNTSRFHSRITETLTPFNNGIPMSGMDQMLDVTTASGQAMLDGLATREALIMSYSNDYLLMALVTLFAFPMILLLRKSIESSAPPSVAAD